MQPEDSVVVEEPPTPAFELDVRAWAEMTGHTLEELEIGKVFESHDHGALR